MSESVSLWCHQDPWDVICRNKLRNTARQRRQKRDATAQTLRNYTRCIVNERRDDGQAAMIAEKRLSLIGVEIGVKRNAAEERRAALCDDIDDLIGRMRGGLTDEHDVERQGCEPLRQDGIQE